ncbi:MAG: NAD(P)-dependent alcohol dehydrogenase [Oscillospiraceae bacterium]|nr:NAD(P)-dependent alcohol dehydrogenase [Oscillospiraceae bacterium]
MQNRTAYLVATGKLEIKDSDMPVVKADDLLIEIKYVGVCGSDLAGFKSTGNMPYPVVLGHECAGEVIGMGENVKNFNIGDRVAIEPGIPCMKCSYCLTGRYNLCSDMNFMACPPWELAALHKYISFPAMMCFKLPNNVSIMEGALVEPLAVGMHAVTRSGVTLGQTILILGSGCIGLTTLLSAKAHGVTNIYMADIFDIRLNKAKELGATEVINSANVDLVDRIMELTDNLGVDMVFEAAGNPETAKLTQQVVKKGGKIVIIGNVHGEVPFNLIRLATREVDLVGIFRYLNLYPKSIDAITSGIIDIKSICTDIYPFEEVQKAFDDAYERKMEVVKAVIEF